jgi:NAD(P)-dependent dehydrogenase (short-subunit alcohol dehydrogenase family)
MNVLSDFLALRGGRRLSIAIVGASGGIGQAFVSEFVASDLVDKLYCISRSQQPIFLNQSTYTNIVQLSADLVDESSIQQAAAKIADENQPLDLILVATGFLHNQSGLKPEKSLNQLNVENFIESMRVNALGPALVAKYFIPLLNKEETTFFGALSARVGSISDNGLGGWHSYRASKAALNMLIKNIAIEYRRKLPKAIIAGLHPGTVDTSLSQPFQKNVPENKLFTPEYSAKQLLSVINRLSIDDSGNCFAWDGKQILF